MEVTNGGTAAGTRSELQITRWATIDSSTLSFPSGPFELSMVNSQGTGTPLLKSGNLGADLIYFAAGEGVEEHVHVGKHVLFVLKGMGRLRYDGVDHDLQPGLCYLVDSMIAHALFASDDTDLLLLVIGDDHRGLADPARMELTGNIQPAW